MRWRPYEKRDAARVLSWLEDERAFGDMGAGKVTIGVFENNPQAQRCYYSLGFARREERDEYITVMGESWKCLESELEREDYFNRQSV